MTIDCSFNTENQSENDKIKYMKYVMCLSYYTKSDCTNKNCRFAHDINELIHTSCKYGDKCDSIQRIKNGVYRNITNKKLCLRFHSDETVGSYLFRIKPKKCQSKINFKELIFEKPKMHIETNEIPTEKSHNEKSHNRKWHNDKSNTEKWYNDKSTIDTKYTMLCKSIFEDKCCIYGKNCDYAHHVLDMIIRPCIYGSSCRFALVLEPENHNPENHNPENHNPENHNPENHNPENHNQNNLIYCNTGDEQPCYGWHPNESIESYGKRMKIHKKYYTKDNFKGYSKFSNKIKKIKIAKDGWIYV
jgi:hypothetical protein